MGDSLNKDEVKQDTLTVCVCVSEGGEQEWSSRSLEIRSALTLDSLSISSHALNSNLR